jgi:hypothetical protein
VLTTCQPSTVWCSGERLPAAAAQPAKVRQSCSATDLFIYLFIYKNRRIFGPKRDEVTEGWRQLHNEEVHHLLRLPDIVRMIESRRMRWVGHVACMEQEKLIQNVHWKA